LAFQDNNGFEWAVGMDLTLLSFNSKQNQGDCFELWRRDFLQKEAKISAENVLLYFSFSYSKRTMAWHLFFSPVASVQVWSPIFRRQKCERLLLAYIFQSFTITK
jgi:hypothetical protein